MYSNYVRLDQYLKSRAGEKARRLRALADLLEDLSLIPSAHRTANNHL